MTQDQMNALADKLDKIQASENWGNGVNCVKSIVWYLEHGYFEKACAVANNEWDKISSYRNISTLLIKNGLFIQIHF